MRSFLPVVLIVLISCNAMAQDNKQIVRLAKLTIDAAQLDQYNVFLKEEIEMSLKVEPGVLTLYAVAEKNKPTNITILEIYEDEDAYKKHIQTTHFLKYKNGTKNMVLALELVDQQPLLPGIKIKQR